MRGWLYRDIIFSLLTIFGQGVIILWHNILTSDNIWSESDYIVTSYFHSWQYFVWGWLYSDMIFSPLTIFGRGWLYRYIIFSLLAIFGQGVILSWHYIFTPGNIWWGGVLTIFSEGVNIFIIFSLLIIFGEGVTISWHYIFTPGNIWRGWVYCDIVFSLLTIFGEGVIISWHIFTPEDIWSGGDYIVTLQYHFWHYPRIWHWMWLYLNIFTSKFDSAVIPGFIIHIHIFTPWNSGGGGGGGGRDMLMDCINSLWCTKICKKS